MPDQVTSNIDMRTLAQEVAAVLSQNQLPRPKDLPVLPQVGLSVQNHDQDEHTSQTGEQPPNYQAATGPSTGPSIRPSGKV